MLGQTRFGTDIEHTQETHRAVDRNAHDVGHAIFKIALQQAVDCSPYVADIAKEIADPGLYKRGQHILIHGRHRLQNHLVELVVEAEHRSVVVLQRVVWIAAGGTAGQCQHCAECRDAVCYFHLFPSAPSATLLNRN